MVFPNKKILKCVMFQVVNLAGHMWMSHIQIKLSVYWQAKEKSIVVWVPNKKSNQGKCSIARGVTVIRVLCHVFELWHTLTYSWLYRLPLCAVCDCPAQQSIIHSACAWWSTAHAAAWLLNGDEVVYWLDLCWELA